MEGALGWECGAVRSHQAQDLSAENGEAMDDSSARSREAEPQHIMATR